MKFLAEIEILPLKGLLDPQGKAAESGLPRIDIEHATNVRVGKFITMELDASSISTNLAQLDVPGTYPRGDAKRLFFGV